MITVFKASKITLVFPKHCLIKTTEEKMGKTAISISYSGPVSSLEAAESLSGLKKALPLKLV